MTTALTKISLLWAVAGLALTGCAAPASAPQADATAATDAGTHAGPSSMPTGPVAGEGNERPDPMGPGTEPQAPIPNGKPRDDARDGVDDGPAADAGDIMPLYDGQTVLEPELHFDRGDAIVTRFGDRGRDRHGREDQFQSYDHYLPHYWEHRTARIQFVDRVAKGGASIDVSFVTEWKLGPAEFRAWYHGMGTVAHYSGNYAPLFTVDGPGTYDRDHQRTSDAGTQYRYSYTIESAITLDGQHEPLAVGQFMEIEVSQFLDNPPVGRANYYGTVFLYEVGHGGLLPWQALGDFDDKGSERENSHPLPERAWLGGRTTLPYAYSDEPDNHFMQMATNLAGDNAQPFVRGRRVHHTDMLDGSHNEGAANGTFAALRGLAGARYIHPSCDGCHLRNGRAAVVAVGEPLDRWVFKVGGPDGAPAPTLGAVLQPRSADPNVPPEPMPSIARWQEDGDGLQAPIYAFDGAAPARYSARLAPQLVGMGLLDAIPEDSILAREDVNDRDGDGISGRAQRTRDPATGEARLGRFGWKAAASSLRHQVAAALNSDMGVMTSLLPSPDCGTEQADCGQGEGPELDDTHFEDLVKYVALLGVRARRDVDDPEALHGEAVFERIGCAGCHAAEMTTSEYHPLAELRGQRIHPYTDLLLHDMGEGLADNLGEADASGAEWRTTPLWGIGLSPCVTGGVEGPFQNQVCKPSESYLHDGRARTLDEAIRWHGGESQPARDAYLASDPGDQEALLTFLRSL